jgi:hypothetical protein
MIVSDSPTLHSKWLLLLKIDISTNVKSFSMDKKRDCQAQHDSTAAETYY